MTLLEQAYALEKAIAESGMYPEDHPIYLDINNLILKMQSRNRGMSHVIPQA